jgi:hypothetical protein
MVTRSDCSTSIPQEASVVLATSVLSRGLSRPGFHGASVKPRRLGVDMPSTNVGP